MGETAAVCVTYVSSSGEMFYQCDGPGHERLKNLEDVYLDPDKVNIERWFFMSVISHSFYNIEHKFL